MYSRRTRLLTILTTVTCLLFAACGSDEEVGAGVEIDPTAQAGDGALRDPQRTTTTLPPNLAGDVGGATTTAPPDTSGSAAQATTTTTEKLVVKIQDDEDGQYFEPLIFRVAVGGTVTWVNASTRGKTRQIVADDQSFVSPPLAPGDEFAWTFTTPGTYGYRDDSRPYTSGTIEVVAA